MSSVQPVEERSLEQGGFNQDEIEKPITLLGTLKKPLGTCSLAHLSKFPISIELKVLDETFTNSWIVDLGATNHMTHSSHKFNKYNPYPCGRKKATIDSSLTTIAGIGNVQISPMLTLRSVFHVPMLSTNLVYTKAYTRFVLQCDFLPTHYVWKTIGLAKE